MFPTSLDMNYYNSSRVVNIQLEQELIDTFSIGIATIIVQTIYLFLIMLIYLAADIYGNTINRIMFKFYIKDVR